MRDTRAYALGLSPGRYVRMSVTDDGPGMDQATVSRAPEPFFTTTAPLHSGLGLAVVHGIARRAGGTLKLTSVPDEGTTASIWLASASPVAVEGVAATTPRIRRVLLAEDDPQVSLFVRELLLRRGVEVVACQDGEEALQKARRQSFDLLVSDVMMPRRDGISLVRELRASRRDLPVLLVTGFSDAVVPQDLGCIPLLTKPFSIGDFYGAIDQLIREPERA